MPGTNSTTPATPASTTTTAKPAATPTPAAKVLAYPLALPALQGKLKAASAMPHAVGTTGHGVATYQHCHACAWAFSAPQARPNCQVPAACAKRVACLATGAPVVLARNTPAVPYVLGARGVARPVYSGNAKQAAATVPYGVACAVRAAVAKGSKALAVGYVPWAQARKAGMAAPAAPAPRPAARKPAGKAKATPAAAPKLHSGAQGTTATGTAPAAPAATPAVLAGLTK